MKQPSNSSGFTLIEMLVALAIFAMLASAGVGLLRASVDTQSGVERRLYELGSLGRVQALLANDIGQVVNRPTRAGGGTRPAFIGQPDRMEFVRGGWANLDGEKRSDLQRVSWRFTGNKLLRAGFAGIDGDQDGVGAAIAPAVAQAAFRYRAINGQWSASFDPAPDQPLPAAVELTLTPPGRAAIIMVMALPQSLPTRPEGGE